MTKIRKLYYFDKKNAREMISFLDNSDTYVNSVMFNPFIPLHHLLPIRFKYLPESYVLKDKKDMKGLITIAPSRCPQKQMEIQKLLFEENCYDDAGELIQYVVSKYKAMGTASIIVRIDDYLPELIKLFVSKCGFNQLSYEKLWAVKIDTDNIGMHGEKLKQYDKKMFREFRNSDAPVVANIHNQELLPHFRTLLGKDPKEFKDSVFPGLSYFSEYKYVCRDKKTKNIKAYISIKTSDNENYILDVIQSTWEDIDINIILSFAYDKIKNRKQDAKLFIKTKKYTQIGEKYEKDFMENNFECVRNQAVLTNSSAKIIKDTERSKKFTVLNQFYGGIGAINNSKLTRVL